MPSRTSVSELLTAVEHAVTALEPDSTNRPAPSIHEFGRRYFPAYCQLPSSRFHIELCAELERILAAPDGQRFACAAPRGTAKSTWASLIFVIYCIVYEHKKFVMLITNTFALARSMIADVKHELESNHLLKRDFPEACGEGPVWRQDEIETRNGVKMLALAAGKRIRGRKHHQHRPDLFIIDDLEHDENMRNPEQREKLADWLNKAVLKARGLGKKAHYVVVGTILHFDSVLARLLDPRRSPGWRGVRYQSIINWSERSDLWDAWKSLYTDWRKPDEDREAAAEEFFASNSEEMLRGAEVLWPEAESYLDLMKLRLDEGDLSFDSEKQNQPIDPSTCDFQEIWFRWVDEVLIDGEPYLVGDGGIRIPLRDCDIFGATDPSMGKQDQYRDPSAIVTIAAWPGQDAAEKGDYRFFFVLDASIGRRHPRRIMDDIWMLHRLRGYQRHGVESVQFQELFAEMVQEAMPDLPIIKLTPITDKKLRIQKLSIYISTGRMMFNRKLSELYDQLRYFPHGRHDDGPDALSLCMDVITSRIGWRIVLPAPDSESVRRKGPYQQQLEDQLSGIVDFDVYREPALTCADCAYLIRRPGNIPWCDFQRIGCAETERACEYYQCDSSGD